MRWDHIKPGWSRLTHHVRSRWNRLSEHEVQAIDGEREALAKAIAERYGLDEKQTDWEISAWQNAYSDRWLYEDADAAGSKRHSEHSAQ